MHCFLRLFLPVLVLLLATASPAQDAEPVPIQKGQSLSGSITGDQPVNYSLELQENQFVYGHVNQIDMDAVVRVYDPSDTPLGSFDFGGPQTTDAFQFDAESAGTYRIEVSGFSGDEGTFTILIEGIEKIATSPKKRVAQLTQPYSGEDTPGGVVAVVEGGAISFCQSFGLANLSHGIPFERESITNIGSTSKQFTCLGILLLENEGLLSLDDDVRDHIPELPDLGETVTVRHLMTHTSGYREFLNTLAIAGRRLDQGDYIDREEVLEMIQRQPELQNAPGAEWNYNNSAFSLLTTIIERKTEMDFPDYMRERVFEPLGMKDTRVRSHRLDVIPGSAQGYGPSEGSYREMVDLGGAVGAGGIYTTVDDLAKWMRNYRTGEVGGPTAFERMTTSFVTTEGDTTGYGFGLFIDTFRGVRRVHHGGADTAHRSQVLYFPDLDAGVIAQSNNATFPVGSIANQVAELFFEDELTPESGDETDEEGSADAGAAEAPFDPDSYDPEDFDALAGRYELEAMPGFILEFTREGDDLFTQATGQPRFPIRPTSPTTFALDVVEASITFNVQEDGTVPDITLHQNGNHRAVRLEDEPWEPTMEAMEEYAGTYFSEELEAFYTVAVEDSSMVLQHRRWADATLNPSEEDSFRAGFPIATVDFMRDEGGAVIGFRAGNGRTRDVIFRKQP